MENLLFWIIARGKEPSSWAGLMGLAATLGVYLSPDVSAAAVQLITALFGFLAVIMPERKE